jgi:hypothetical protein
LLLKNGFQSCGQGWPQARTFERFLAALAFPFFVGDLLFGCRYLRGQAAFWTLQQFYTLSHTCSPSFPSLLIHCRDYTELFRPRCVLFGVKILRFLDQKGYRRVSMPLCSSRIITDSLPSYKLIADIQHRLKVRCVRGADDLDGGGVGSPARLEAVKDVGAGGPLAGSALAQKRLAPPTNSISPHPISASRPSDHH